LREEKKLTKARKLIVREESEPSWEYGYNPRSRPVDLLMNSAAVILDKQRGPTSHDVVASFKRLAKLDRAGHTGTLAI
jgi:tRNA U55 pseudouridine synthase TruB